VKPEARLRARVRLYLDAALPITARWSSIEHGRQHSGDATQRAREWERLKSQGVKTGLADLMIWHCKDFFAVELKAGANGLTEAQKGWRDFFWASGQHYIECRSVVELHDYLVTHGLIDIAPIHRHHAEAHDRALAEPEKPKRAARPAKPRATKKGLSVAAKVYGL